MANFKNLSRYTNGQVTKNRALKDFLILRRPLSLAEDDGDVFVLVTQELEKRPDLVAAKAYDNPDLWWVIYEFNGIRDPFFDLKQGMLLRIPALDRVLEAIDALGTT
jgi:hypothetical protein